MRSFRNIAIISVIAFITSLFIIVSVTSSPPKESKIIRDFSAHRAAYEQVLTMLWDDKGMDTVADYGIENTESPISKIPPDGGMPVVRYQKYLALLKQIGASRVGRGSQPLRVAFDVWASGWGGDTRHVNVCWLEREPSNTVATLDAFYRTAKPRKPPRHQLSRASRNVAPEIRGFGTLRLPQPDPTGRRFPISQNADSEA